MAPATPFLLTPGPLTTSDETKRSMLRDWRLARHGFHPRSTAMCASSW